MRWILLAGLIASGAQAADFADRFPRPHTTASDAALCAGLAQASSRLRAIGAAQSDFPGQVFAAFSGEDAGETKTNSYISRGAELLQLNATVEAQCRASLGYGAASVSEAEAAAVRRRAESAKRTADLYLNLPLTVARIDQSDNSLEISLRPRFAMAMDKIANDPPDYQAAATIAHAAHALMSRIRK